MINELNDNTNIINITNQNKKSISHISDLNKQINNLTMKYKNNINNQNTRDKKRMAMDINFNKRRNRFQSKQLIEYVSNDNINSINIPQKQSKSFDNINKDIKIDKTNNKIKKINNKIKKKK